MAIALRLRLAGEAPSAGRQLVVAARRPLFLAGHAFLLPPRAHAAFGIEPAQDGVDGAARQAGGVHDVEAMWWPSSRAWRTSAVG